MEDPSSRRWEENATPHQLERYVCYTGERHWLARQSANIFLRFNAGALWGCGGRNDCWCRSFQWLLLTGNNERSMQTDVCLSVSSIERVLWSNGFTVLGVRSARFLRFSWLGVVCSETSFFLQCWFRCRAVRRRHTIIRHEIYRWYFRQKFSTLLRCTSLFQDSKVTVKRAWLWHMSIELQPPTPELSMICWAAALNSCEKPCAGFSGGK